MRKRLKIYRLDKTREPKGQENTKRKEDAYFAKLTVAAKSMASRKHFN